MYRGIQSSCTHQKWREKNLWTHTTKNTWLNTTPIFTLKRQHITILSHKKFLSISKIQQSLQLNITRICLAEAVKILSFKKRHKNIRLVACVPCPDQDKYYSVEAKVRYYKILEKADEKIVLSESYTKFCMHARDRYMADRADVLIAYCKRDKGGTAYTVNYFSKKYPLKEKVFL